MIKLKNNIEDLLDSLSKSKFRGSFHLNRNMKEYIKEKGLDNNLLELIAADPAFNLSLEELQKTMDPAKYVGRAPIQVDVYLKNVVNPVLEANKDILGVTAEINV